MGISAGNAAVRVGASLLVAALHLIALMLVLTASRKHRVKESTEPRALTLVNVEPSERILPAVPPETAAAEPKRRTRLPGGSSPANVTPANESAARADPTPIRDWRGSMEMAATAAVGKAIREGSYQPLGTLDRQQLGSSSAPSIFEAPRRKAGDIEHDSTQGRTLIWHDEHCFTELRFPTIKDANALVGAPNPPKCMRPIGKRKSRGDLFESMDEPKAEELSEDSR